ncbi:hypothetical protein Stube_35300 [Streptomyces tubercidicus]|uniref:Uncharacterized protein n=1 Tax=Streptomyces tubercidicus TaxID=47759 RepID=A0A640UTF8_9ACTN|nr:hypothetical protein Stube_35300 [Streptomyces tubercidicus]
MVPAILPHIRPVVATRDGADAGKVSPGATIDRAGRHRADGTGPRAAGQPVTRPSDSTDS